MSAEDSFNPPKAVQEEASRALKWISEGNAGVGFTDVGRARARDLSSGRSVSLDTIKRMNSYFARHEVDKKGAGWSQGENGYPSPGRVAWAAWGGDAGKSWAKEILSSFSGVKHMIDVDIEKIIAHYGVKGQRWGVRTLRSNGGITKYKGKPKNLTDQELADRIKRLETEKKYKELNKRQVGVGRKHINEVLVHIGKESAKKFGVGAATTTTKIVLNRKFASPGKDDLKALGDQIFPKKK